MGLDHYLDNARKHGNVSQNTRCSFMRVATDRGVLGLSDSVSGPAIGVEGEMAAELIDTTVGNDVLKFWPWVNQVCCNQLMNLNLAYIMCHRPLSRSLRSYH